MQLCSKCSIEHDVESSIDIEKIASTLSPGEVWSGAICEKCEIIAICKDNDGNIKVMKLVDEGTSSWEDI